MMQGWRAATLATAVATCWGSFPGMAATNGQYDTSRVIGYQRNECLRQDKGRCVTVGSELRSVRADHPVDITVTCNSRYPHVVGWDARHNEHISLKLLTNKVTPAKSGNPGSITILAKNEADTAGFAKIFVGCSNSSFQKTPFMRTRMAVPTKNLRHVSGNRPGD
jgi:hypothetical protein